MACNVEVKRIYSKQIQSICRKKGTMKNKTLIMMMTAMIAGAMVIGTVAYVPAATEETAEVTTDDADAELKSQLYGVWPVNLDSYMYMPDGRILDSKRNYLCDYKIEGDKIVWDLTNASEDFIGGVQDPKVEVKLLPMDASKLPEAQQDTDYYYSGDEDKLMELTVSETDSSDPMNPETKEDVVYSAKSIMDQASYGKALLYGYTWQSDVGSLTVDKDGNISLNDGEQTGELSIDNLDDYRNVSFKWDGSGIASYKITEMDADKIIMEGAEDSSKTITLTDKVAMENE